MDETAKIQKKGLKQTKEDKIGTQKASSMKEHKLDRVFLKSNKLTQEKSLLSN